jgi:small subunit ribosomal protein S5
MESEKPESIYNCNLNMQRRDNNKKFERKPQNREENTSGIEDVVLKPRRVATKRPGGANMHYSVLAAAGDRNGMVGIGLAKSKEMSAAISKSKDKARRTMVKIELTENGSIPHEVYIKNGASILYMKPAPLGAGIMAGGSVRQILDLAGIKNISVKIIGTNNQISNAYTVLKALKSLRSVNK